MPDERPWRKGVKMHKWTEEEDDFIRENARMFKPSRMRELFDQRFGWMPTPGQYRARRQRPGEAQGARREDQEAAEVEEEALNQARGTC